MASEEESDGFDPSPQPTKRRRIACQVLDDIDSDIENTVPLPTKPRQRQRTKKNVASPPAESPPPKKKPKPKHLIRVHQAPVELEDIYCTQAPNIPSSPSRIRGAIWRKPAQTKVDVEEPRKDEGRSPRLSPNHDLIAEDDIDDDLANTSSREEPPRSVGKCDGNLQNIPLARVSPNAGVENRSRRRETNPDSESENEFDVTSDISPFEDRASGLGERNAESRKQGQSHNDRPVLRQITTQSLSAPAPSQIDFDIAQELADLPSDAFASSFSSPQKSPVRLGSDVIVISSQKSPSKGPNLVGPQKTLRQMTLFGGAAQQMSEASQATKKHNFPVTNKNEKPTHHKLNEDAMRTYVYPTNLGTIRDYQFNIVARGLFHNLLVALPTGLGKTFIAATVMLNWFRWTKDAQIVFVAPTKPLVSQQVDACFGIAGIPRSQTSMLTGGIPPGVRAEEYTNKRVFFMTPQTIINDLKSGICDPKRIVLLVVDEAHRATGAYAYVEVVKFLRRFNESFRVLALTATPGGSVEAVQEVIDGLDVSRVEIRTEFSLDIRQYVHSRKTESITFDNSEEMELVMDHFSKALQPVLNKLNQFNAYWSRDPMTLTAYGLTQARQRWMGTPAAKNANFAVKGMVNRLFTVLASLAHSIELLKFHGIGPFYHGMVNFRNAQEGMKGGKYEKEILESEHFLKMMTRLQFWINNPTFIGHPKLDYLQGVVLDHFVGAGEGRGVNSEAPPSATRVMIFAHYRDSAEEIVRVLKRNEPMVRPHVFVGQAASKGSEGMDQKRQLEIIQDFKTGKYNTLVATSIGEEGLDIGEVDLIICYDSSASPIRMLQRMGRTGRKRAGKIVLLLMKGKEENSFIAAKDNYEKMQQMIAAGTRFNFHEDLSPRIVPKDINPVVDKRVVDIPLENTQADLPEPKKRAGRAPKRPAKKFHMPDGVRTGFVRASRMDGDDEELEGEPETTVKNARKLPTKSVDDLEPIPTLDEVLLSKAQEHELLEKYRNFKTTSGIEFVPQLRLNGHTARQRVLGRTSLVAHGNVTKSTVKMLKAMHNFDEAMAERFRIQAQNTEVDKLRGREIRVVPDEHHINDDDLPPVPVARSTTRARARGTNRAQKPAPAKARGRPKKSKTTDTDAAEEAASSSPPRTSPRMQMQSQGISLGSDTSGEDEVEEPDSELRDFIVDDAESENEPEATMSSSLPVSRRNHVKPHYVSPTQIGESSSGDDLPDLNEMLRTKDTVPKKITKPPPKRKRKVIEDSSD